LEEQGKIKGILRNPNMMVWFSGFLEQFSASTKKKYFPLPQFFFFKFSKNA